MAQQDKKEDVPYQYRDDAEPHKQTGNINSRNNNASGDTIGQRNRMWSGPTMPALATPA